MLRRFEVALSVLCSCFAASSRGRGRNGHFHPGPRYRAAPAFTVASMTGWAINASGQVVGYGTVEDVKRGPGQAECGPLAADQQRHHHTPNGLERHGYHR